MVPSIAYCEECGKILGYTIGPARVECPGCGRIIEAKPVEARGKIGAAE